MSLRHPSRHPTPLRLYGRRVMLRPLAANDHREWSDVRQHNHEWLTVWEPSRLNDQSDPTSDRSAFAARCAQRDRDRANGTAYQFGLYIDQHVVGEVNINNVVRGALQSGTIGYWIDQRHAGQGYVAEAVVMVFQFGFEQLGLHRLEICIVPRNERSRRVMDKLGIREEGTAERYLEINGIWEDHIRYAITAEEWQVRRPELMSEWVDAAS